MQTDTSDYLPGKQKAFDLVPHKDDGYLIVQARRAALRDGDLDFGARVLFCELLDLSLNAAVWRSRGSVTISVTKLCEHLCCGRASIHQWNAQLTRANHVWISSQAMPNFWDMNTYHIVALDPQRDSSQTLRQDGLWGNGTRRGKAPSRLALEGGVVHKTVAEPEADSSISQENGPGTPHERDARRPESDRGRIRKQSGADQNLIAGGSESGRGATGKQHAGRPENSMRPVQKTDHIRKPLVMSIRGTKEGEGSFPPKKALSRASKQTSWGNWAAKLKKLFPRELEALKADLVKQQKQADQQDNALIADISMRIEAIDLELYGGRRPEPARKAVKPARILPVPQKPLSEAEELEGARYMVSIGKANRLSEAQKALLAKAEAK